MGKDKRLLVLITVIILILVVTGCWSRRELETLAFVMAMGIDQAQEPDQIEMTVQIIKPSEISSKSGGGGQGKKVWNVKEKGYTLFETIRKFTLKSSRKLFFPHNYAVIYSQELAQKGLNPYLDFIIRDSEPRRDTWLLIAKDKANKIIESEPTLENNIGLTLDQIIESYGNTSQIIPVNFQDFLVRLLSETTSPIAPIVVLENKELTLEGTAVFKKDKMVGTLNTRETRGLLWVLDKVKSGIITVKCPGCDGKANLELIRTSSKIIPELKNNALHVTVKIKADGNFAEQNCPQDLATLAAWNSLERRTAETIRNEVQLAFKKAQELNTDVFGFGEAIYRKYPALWREIKDNWDEYFLSLELTVDVEARLRNPYMTTEPSMSRK